jgi:hypothetical protein
VRLLPLSLPLRDETTVVKDGLHVVITADMPAPVYAVECPSGHELASTTTGNTARIQVPHATPSQRTLNPTLTIT